MNEVLTIECPHCGESFTLAFDVSEGSAAFTVDCEVCCRPMNLSVQVGDDGGIAGLEIEAE